MLDPYLVLGVGKYDDDQTVKKAYRQLSKQYHPDNNLNNPNKDAAEETFKKIQQAYEQIMHERSIGIGGPNDVRRKQNESSSGTSSGYGSRSSYSSNNSYQSSSASSSTGSTGNGYSGGKTEYKTKDRYNEDWYKNSAYNSANNYSSGASGSSGYSYGYNSGYSSGNDSGYGSGSSSGYYGSNSNNSSGSYDSGYGNGNSGGYYTGSYSNDSYGQGYGSGSGYYSGNTDSFFTEDTNSFLNNVAKELNQKHFFEAWDILNSMQNRNDVWYYYSAIANLGLGNSITALSHARKAKEMDPTRPEYDELINGIQSGALHYQGKSDMFVPQKANKGNICLKLIIANIALNIFCGGGGVLCHGFCGMC